MRRSTLRTPAWTLAGLGVAIALAACGSAEDPNTVGNRGNDFDDGYVDPNDPSQQPQTPEEQVKQILDARKTDYGEALRTASLKLRDQLPSLAEIKQIQAAPDDNAKKVVYEKLIDDMLASPQFSQTMVKFWKDTFRTAQVGNVQDGRVSRDFAANFAAQVTVEGRSYNELFTATSNTCPTVDVDAETNAVTFTAGNCPAPADQIADAPTVGVLTDPGLQSQYFANMAFRRVRFIQETFACSKFPAAYAATPVPMGAGVYTGQHPFESIAGKKTNPDARVDFHDTQAVICANCHNDMNHIAPLFLNYDQNGALRDAPQVEVPIPRNPKAARSDYLPDAEGLAWRFGKPITDIASLGKALTEDPEVPRCAVNRVWNYAMSRGDIVNDLATVPNAVTQPYVDAFASGGLKLKETIRAVFKSEDFTKF
jgi:hypothetical protein